jgi:hypothetical protein
MAREDIRERGLPSPEARRQILQRAGIVLNEARDLIARLDRHESAFARTSCEHRAIAQSRQRECRRPADAPFGNSGIMTASRTHPADQTLATGRSIPEPVPCCFESCSE